MIAIAIDTLLHNAQAAIMANRESLVSQAKVAAIKVARSAVDAIAFH